MTALKSGVRFTPVSDRIADMREVRFVPKPAVSRRNKFLKKW